MHLCNQAALAAELVGCSVDLVGEVRVTEVRNNMKPWGAPGSAIAEKPGFLLLVTLPGKATRQADAKPHWRFDDEVRSRRL